MKNLLRCFVLLACLTSAVVSCKKDADATPQEKPATAELTGTWQLTQRECLCPRAVPNELVKFTDNGFSFFKDGQPSAYGTYVVVAGAQNAPPVLQLTYAENAAALRKAAITTLTADSLVLDFGIAFDAPRDTYKRLR